MQSTNSSPLTNLTDFWDNPEPSHPTPSDDTIQSVENTLGYKLPAAYLDFIKSHNGGKVHKNCYPTAEQNSWAEDHIAINKFYPLETLIDNTNNLINEWSYPKIGIAICDTPSAGHEAVFLDYSECGPTGEPRITYIMQEANLPPIILADNFTDFVQNLTTPDHFKN